jgi:hypothetical protein
MWSKHCAVFVLMAGLGAVVAAGAESAGDRLQKGIYQEETVGDLDAAMKIYQEIVANEKANRPHVAQAKHRLGMCHVKKGEKKKAVGVFEGLIKEFPGQAQLLEQARGRLAALGYFPESEEPAGVQLQETWPFPGLDAVGVLAISRDGRYCAFRDDETGGLVVRDLTTGEDQPPIEGAVGDPASISPDGKWIAYTRWNDRNECDVLRIAGIDGSQQRVLYSNEEKSEIGGLTWSPDSRHVLTTFYDTGDERVDTIHAVARIAMVAVADGSARVLKVLAPEEHNNPMPLFTPDGRHVSFDRMMDAASVEEDIVLIPLAGGPEIPLLEGPADDHQLGWLPDGRSLLFFSDRLFVSDRGGRGLQVWMIQVEGGKPVGLPRLVGQRPPSYPFRGPVRTPTGGWAFYCITGRLRILQVVGWEPGVETSVIAPEKQPSQPADVKLTPPRSQESPSE